MSDLMDEESVGSSKFQHLTQVEEVTSRPHCGSPTGGKKFKKANESTADQSYPIALNIVPFAPVIAREHPTNDERRRYKDMKLSSEPSRKPRYNKAVEMENEPRQQKQKHSALKMRADNDLTAVTRNTPPLVRRSSVGAKISKENSFEKTEK